MLLTRMAAPGAPLPGTKRNRFLMKNPEVWTKHDEVADQSQSFVQTIVDLGRDNTRRISPITKIFKSMGVITKYLTGMASCSTINFAV